MNNLYRLRRYMRPYVSRVAAAVAAMAGVAAAMVGIIKMLEPIVDEGLQENVTVGQLQRLAGVMVVLYLVLGIARFLSSYLMGSVGFSIVRDLRIDLFLHLELLPLDYHTRHSTGGLMSRVTADVLAVQEVLSRVLVDLMRDGLTVIGLVGLMFWTDWRLALAFLLVAPLLVGVITRLGRLMRVASRNAQEGLGELSTLLQETLTGIRIVKAFGMEAFEAEKFRRAAQRLFRHSTRALRLQSISSPLMELIAAIGGAAVLVYGALQIRQQAFTAGQFFMFLTAAIASATAISAAATMMMKMAKICPGMGSP